MEKLGQLDLSKINAIEAHTDNSTMEFKHW